MSDLLTRLDEAYKSKNAVGDLWNLCEEAEHRIRELESALKTIHSFAFDDAHGLDDDDCLDRIRAMAYKVLETPR